MPNVTVWGAWNVTTSTNSTITSNTWQAWNTGSTNATTYTVDVWVTWNGTNTAEVARFVNHIPVPAYAPPTAADLARRERERRTAERKAERLLLDHLTKEQAAEYKREGHFHLLVGDRVYRIERGITHNVKLVEEGHDVETLCIHPTEAVPAQDNMLAQKLLLENDEASFRRIANITPLRRRQAA